MNKLCPRCRLTLPLTEFYPQGNKYRAYCKACDRMVSVLSSKKEVKRKWTRRKPIEWPLEAFKYQISQIIQHIMSQDSSNRAVVRVTRLDIEKSIVCDAIEFWVYVDVEGNKGLFILCDKKLYPIACNTKQICGFMLDRNMIFGPKPVTTFHLLPELTGGRSFRDFGIISFSYMKKKALRGDERAN